MQVRSKALAAIGRTGGADRLCGRTDGTAACQRELSSLQIFFSFDVLAHKFYAQDIAKWNAKPLDLRTRSMFVQWRLMHNNYGMRRILYNNRLKIINNKYCLRIF